MTQLDHHKNARAVDVFSDGEDGNVLAIHTHSGEIQYLRLTVEILSRITPKLAHAWMKMGMGEP